MLIFDEYTFVQVSSVVIKSLNKHDKMIMQMQHNLTFGWYSSLMLFIIIIEHSRVNLFDQFISQESWL